MARQDALIHYYFKVDPDTLSDSEYAKHWSRLEYVLYDEKEDKIILR